MTHHQILKQQAFEIMEMIEDAVEYYCDTNLVSGEQVWVMINALSEAKVHQFPVNEEDDYFETGVEDSDEIEQ